VATPERAAALKGQPVIEAELGLPAIAMHSVMIDRFRRDPGHGWRFTSYICDVRTRTVEVALKGRYVHHAMSSR
jgi:hypothetical protein